MHLGRTALAFPERPAPCNGWEGGYGISRFSRMEICVHALVLRPRGVHQQLALTLLAMLPSALSDDVSTPISLISRLNSPACTYPCQRFAAPLPNANA